MKDLKNIIQAEIRKELDNMENDDFFNRYYDSQYTVADYIEEQSQGNDTIYDALAEWIKTIAEPLIEDDFEGRSADIELKRTDEIHRATLR